MHVRGARMVVAAFVLQNHGDAGRCGGRPAVGTRSAAMEETSEEEEGRGMVRPGWSWCDRTRLQRTGLS